MAFIINPDAKFRQSSYITKLSKKKEHPMNCRDAFCISKVYPNGIFQIEEGINPCQYDRCYIFSDINYANRDENEQTDILRNLAKVLNAMNCDFKITVANEYRNMQQYIDSVFSDINKKNYPSIYKGMQEWINEKIKDADLHNLKKLMYLTITVRSYSYKEARSYLLGMDTELDRLFKSLQSVILPLNAKQRLDILSNFFYRSEDTINYDFVDELADPVHDVIPVSINAEQNFMIFNGRQYASVLFARSVASTLNERQTIYSLTNMDYQSFCTIDYAPVDKAVLKQKLKSANINNERAIANEIDSKRKSGQIMAGVSYLKEKQKEELEGYIDQVDDNNESCFLVGVLLVVTASTEDQLAERIKSAIQTGKDVGVTLETMNYVQLKAFNTALPVGCRLVKHRRAYFSSSLVALQPFFAQDLIDLNGMFFGVNRTTKNLIFADRKKLASPHGMIVGHTGSGKSFLIKETEVVQTLLSTHDDLTIIDPQNEFQTICEFYDGQYIDFTPKSEFHMNPMEIPDEVFQDQTPNRDAVINAFVADVTGWVFSFCSAAMKNMIFSQEHQSFIGQCIRSLYQRAFQQRTLKWQPTLTDLRDELSKLEQTIENDHDKEMLHAMYNALQEYTEGAYDMFAYPSNLNLHKRFVVFGLANVSSEFWEPVMITIMFFLSNRMAYNRKYQRATRLIIDETQVVTANPSSANMLLKAVVTYRKFGGIVTMAMQNFSRAIDNPELRDMFSNCGYKCFLDQGGMDANAIRQIQDLSSMEYKSLSEPQPGYGLMVWGKKVILFDCRMSNSNPIYYQISTNFHENAAKAKKEEEEKHIKPVIVDSKEADSLSAKILRITATVPITEEEIQQVLSISKEETDKTIQTMLESGALIRMEEDSRIVYKKADQKE